MGSIGSATSKNNVIYDLRKDRLESYNFNDTEKEWMSKALDEAQRAINEIMNDPWGTPDLDHIYDYLIDWFPRSVPGDEAEKIIYVTDDYITTVDFRLREDRDGKLEATLEPSCYSIDEFSDAELEDMGIERRGR